MKKITLSDSPISEQAVEILAGIYSEVAHGRNFPLDVEAIRQAQERYYLITNQGGDHIGGVALRKATGEIRCLEFLPRFRDQGYKSLVLEEVEKRARDLGLNEVHIYLPQDLEAEPLQEAGYHLENSDRSGFHRLYKNFLKPDGKRPDAPLTLGADPELLLVKEDGNVVPASQYFRFEEPEGYGTDGHSDIAEIRPQPATEPGEITASIKQILRSALMTNPELWHLKWRAGGYYKHYGIGGHIHVGFDNRQLSIAKAANSLDYFLAPFILLLEDKVEAIHRRQNYGRLGEHHSKPYGIEYRVPASFIVSPQMSEQIFALTKVVIKQAYRRDFHIPRISEDEKTLFNACDKAHFRECIAERWGVIEKMELFKKYAPTLNPFWKTVQSNQTWNKLSRDIKGPWQVLSKEDWDKIVIPSREDAEKIWEEL